MSELELLACAYVGFIALIVVEMGVSLYRKDGYYRFHEMVVNVGHGVVYQVVDHLTQAVVALPFLALASLVSWPLLPYSPLGWFIAVVLFDLTTYWSHRAHHEVPLLWAVHGVHHAAEDFNLAAALRQPAVQKFSSFVWRLPLALLMPVPMFVGVVVFDFLYQFVQHTRYVGRLGPLEWVMNTPSHHRVHHGTQDKYLDRNYGGIFIIWDRLFGTFQAEEEEPRYGLTRPLATRDGVWGNVALFQRLCRASEGSAEPLRQWLGRVPLSRPIEGERGAAGRRHEAPLAVQAYVLIIALMAPPALAWLLLGHGWGLGERWLVAGLVVATISSAGGLLDGRRGAIRWEALRVITAALCASVWLEAAWPLWVGAGLLGGLLGARQLSGGAVVARGRGVPA